MYDDENRLLMSIYGERDSFTICLMENYFFIITIQVFEYYYQFSIQRNTINQINCCIYFYFNIFRQNIHLFDVINISEYEKLKFPLFKVLIRYFSINLIWKYANVSISKLQVGN